MRKIVCLIIVILLIFVPVSVKAVDTSAKAAVLINGDTGEVIYSQNAEEQLPMASTTKIMTGILLCEYGNFDKQITVTEEMLKVEGSSMGLLAGDKVTLHDLLYGLMLASGNDAANVIAFTVGGSIEGFVELMNKKAEELELHNTHFETPSGLDGETHYTSALDLSRLARYAMQNNAFAEAVSTETAVLNYGNPPYKRSLKNHNKMLQMFDSAVGIKTGYTKKSGRCLVSAAKRDGKYVIAVTLNDPNDWSDHCSMLEYGLKSIKQTNCAPRISSYSIPVVGSVNESLSVNIEPYTVNSLDTDDITCTVYLPRFLYAPIAQGDKVGYVVYKKDDTVLAETDILAECNINSKPVKQKPLEAIFENFKRIAANF